MCEFLILQRMHICICQNRQLQTPSELKGKTVLNSEIRHYSNCILKISILYFISNNLTYGRLENGIMMTTKKFCQFKASQYMQVFLTT